MTRQEVYDYIVAQLAIPVTQVAKVLNSFSKVLDFITESTVSDIIPDWTSTLTFNSDGTGAGKYCLHPDNTGKKRIFQSKTNANLNNQPPTDPLITETTYWLEISQSSGSSIKEWAPGLFGTGLVIVFHNHSTYGRGLCQLLDPARPFQSTNIETEITAGKWSFIAISKDYVDAQILANINGIAWKDSVKARTTAALPANTAGAVNTTLTANVNGAFPAQDGIAIVLNDDILVMNEATQANNGIYRLTQVGDIGTPWKLTRRGDADSSAELQNAVVSVDQGTSHADTSWKQPTDSVVLGTSNIIWTAFNPTVADASETVKGIVELATTAEATTGTDTQRAVTPAGLKAHVDAKLAGALQSVTITLSSAEILNLFTTPKQLIAAPGLGKVIRVIRVELHYHFGTTAYATNTQMSIEYGAQSPEVPAVGDNGALAATASGITFLAEQQGVRLVTQVENTSILVSVETGNPTSGNGDMVIKAWYEVVNML